MPHSCGIFLLIFLGVSILLMKNHASHDKTSWTPQISMLKAIPVISRTWEVHDRVLMTSSQVTLSIISCIILTSIPINGIGIIPITLKNPLRKQCQETYAKNSTNDRCVAIVLGSNEHDQQLSSIISCTSSFVMWLGGSTSSTWIHFLDIDHLHSIM